jgi:hypothetical protein
MSSLNHSNKFHGLIHLLTSQFYLAFHLFRTLSSQIKIINDQGRLKYNDNFQYHFEKDNLNDSIIFYHTFSNYLFTILAFHH